MTVTEKLKEYYGLVKGGLVLGNIITVVAGFLLAAKGNINLPLLAATVLGIWLVMASGCVFNNYIDRDIDGLMERTKNRALITGKISGKSAVIFGSILGILGFLTLTIFTNPLATGVAAVGFFFYVFMYSSWFKRRNDFGTVVGSISGAVPPVVGYVTQSGKLDMAALLLFLIMVTWQMPHFYAIAIRRKDEYAKAHVPVLPVTQGVRATKIQMILFIAAFTLIAPLLTVFGYTGPIYFAVAIFLGLAWLSVAIRGLFIVDPDATKTWARQTFLASLIIMLALFVAISITA